MFEIYRTMLQLMKHKENYLKLKGVVKKQLLDADIRRALTVLENYWSNYPDHETVLPDLFLTELQIHNPDLDEAKLTIFKGMAEIMQHEPDESTAKGLMRSMRTLDFAAKVEAAHEGYQQGHDVDLYETIRDLLAQFEADVSRDDHIDYCRDSIADIIEEAQTGFNLPWFLDCLRGSLPDIRTGDQLIFAARPGRGKTSFCAREAVHVAPLTPDDRPILWFNNESKAAKIKGTIYRAALGKSFQEIVTAGADWATDAYGKCIGGHDRIRIFDIHGRDYKFLESLIQKHNPVLVFFDMLDNVKGFGDAARLDLRLEQLYQWSREMAVIHDFVSIATSQISVEGEGVAWCDQSMLKDSKTAKQGAADAIITMGAVNQSKLIDSRYLYVPKEKSETLPGYRQDCATEVKFDGKRCQFKEAAKLEQEGPNA
jgi:replicative DNA helicase